jgi:glutathione S-transferase
MRIRPAFSVTSRSPSGIGSTAHGLASDWLSTVTSKATPEVAAQARVWPANAGFCSAFGGRLSSGWQRRVGDAAAAPAGCAGAAPMQAASEAATRRRWGVCMDRYDASMQLVGMLDSPYVRRVAVSLHWMGLPFEHRPVSVFRQFEDFAAVNPVVKAPTLVADDGTVLMDSTLILLHAESLAAKRRSLMPSEPRAALRELRLIGLALAGCEKAVQTVYEKTLRPAEKQHGPWLDRVRGQMEEAFDALDTELQATPLAADDAGLTQAGLTTAVVWRFANALESIRLHGARWPRSRPMAGPAKRSTAFVPRSTIEARRARRG